MSAGLLELKETGYDSIVDMTHIKYCVFCFKLSSLLYILGLILWSLFSLCDMLQGPEGPVGARGLRGLQVSNLLVYWGSGVLGMPVVLSVSF